MNLPAYDTDLPPCCISVTDAPGSEFDTPTPDPADDWNVIALKTGFDAAAGDGDSVNWSLECWGVLVQS